MLTTEHAAHRVHWRPLLQRIEQALALPRVGVAICIHEGTAEFGWSVLRSHTVAYTAPFPATLSKYAVGTVSKAY